VTLRATAFAAVIIVLLGWDIAVAGRAAQRRAPSRAFALLSGVTGFLVAPALLVHFGAQSALTGRVLEALSPLGPLVFLLCTVQVAAAWWLGLAGPALAVPLLAFDAMQLVIASVGFAGSRGQAAPHLLMAPGLAQAGLFALAFGPAAFASPLAIVVPLLAPAAPARGRTAIAWRALLGGGAAAAVAALLATAPDAVGALGAFARLGNDRIAERSRESFTSGLVVLPELQGTPSAASLRDDLALADSLDVGALYVRVGPDGARAAALDSLARALEPYRRDSTLVLAAIDAGAPGRLVTADRVVRRLRPDYLVLSGTRETGPLAGAAALAHRLRPATRVAVQLSPAGAADSALFAWATSGASPVDAVVFALFPDAGGAPRAIEALKTAERWMRSEVRTREHWIAAAGAPTVEGEDAQRRFIRHVLAWGTSRSSVQGVVIGESGDYAQGSGLRAASGRLRGAVGDAASSIRSLNETTSPLVP
jgi:hypothetical protein